MATLLEAQRLDAIKGIDVVSAISIVARIGPVERFRDADRLIAFAGLAPGISESDQTRRNGRIGGGGTDSHLRNYLIEATVWARKLTRMYEHMSVSQEDGAKKWAGWWWLGCCVRSIYKILRDGVEFAAGAPTPGSGRSPLN